jgi:hypothetical protein
MQEAVDREIESAVERAKSALLPEFDDLLTDVYS